MTKKRLRNWRRAAETIQAVIILGIPFLKIGGESALRFDIPTLRLHFFGATIWMDDFFIVLTGIIFSIFLIILITQLFGRIWCGWLCPQTVLIDLTWFHDKAKKMNLSAQLLSYLMTFVVCIIVGASLIWYFVSPYEFIFDLMKGTLDKTVWALWLSLTGILFLNYGFLRHTWCATACPYAKLQGALFDKNTMVISFDQRRKDECMDCRACVKACPVNIDIRNGLSSSCINCAECIDACSDKLSKKNRPGLIGYFFGQPDTPRRLIRANTVLTGSAAALIFVLFLWIIYSRNPYDMTILPNYQAAQRISKEGKLLNQYILAIENKSKEDIIFSVQAELNNKELKVFPEKISLKAAEYRRLSIVIISDANDSGITVISLSNDSHPEHKITGTAVIAAQRNAR